MQLTVGQFQAKRSFGGGSTAAASGGNQSYTANTPAPVVQQPAPQVDQRVAVQPQFVTTAPTAPPQTTGPVVSNNSNNSNNNNNANASQTDSPNHIAGSRTRRMWMAAGLAGAGMASCMLGGWAGALLGIVPMAAAGLAATSAMEVPGKVGVVVTGGLALLGLMHGAMPGGQFVTGIMMTTMGVLAGASLSDQIHDGRLHHYLNDMKNGAADMLPKSYTQKQQQ
jgi:hypothetical protein